MTSVFSECWVLQQVLGRVSKISTGSRVGFEKLLFTWGSTILHFLFVDELNSSDLVRLASLLRCYMSLVSR